MFELTSLHGDCDGVSRRAFLRVGGASLFGLSLPSLLAARAAQGAAATSREMNCIILWTDGGMSNIDTLDMKPQAPVEFRGSFQQIASNVPEMPVCEHLPKMAQWMHKVCQIRSIAHTESGDHTAAKHYMLTGHPQRPDLTGQPPGSIIYPSFGSALGQQRGWRNGLPPHVLFGNLPYSGAGYLGSAHNPLTIDADPSVADFKIEDVTIPEAIGPDRTARRRRMLDKLDSWQRQVDQRSGRLFERKQFAQQAYDLITSPAAKRAFKLDEEPAEVRDRYGRTREGQCTLLARRLIEAGVRLVNVNTGGWDTHVQNFTTLKDRLLPKLDMAWSALLEDLQQRGLLENTLVICMGEFGRTPGINGGAGRDHWAPANVVGLSGAGVRMGTVVGATDSKGFYVVGRPDSTQDFGATVYRILGLDTSKVYVTEDGRPVTLVGDGQPIEAVTG